ncbi:MAG: hypothetical protein MR691_08330 [Clostridium sp.]|nr:hypothetical protein [Clostridium sp.]
MYDLEEELLYGKSKLLEEMKKNTGICLECGKTFEQGFRVNSKTGDKIFNKYKYCEKCRSKIAKQNQEQKTTQVTIKYNPYPWQQKFHASKARFKVVSGAARSGKDYSFDKEFDMKFVDMLNEDRGYSLIPRVHGWIIGPTYKLLSQIERNFMHNFPRELVVSYDKENHVIETINGGLIEFRSADDPDSLVSVGLDICYITEAARIKQFDVVIGNLTDRLDSPGRGPNGTGGLMLINSSPRGRSFFNEVCKWGIEGGSKQRPDWETWYISRWDNPTFADRRNKVFDKRISKWVERGDDPYLANERTYEQDLMLSRSDRQYREDILGIPSDEEGAQFPNFRAYAEIEKPALDREKMREYIRKIRTPEPNFSYSIGYDPAKQVDGAWLVVYCEQTGEVVELVRLENVPYTVQINVHIKQLVKKWNYAMVRYGKTGLGEALEDIFKMAGIAYIAYPEQGKNKEKLVENLTTLVKEGKFKIHNVDDIAETAIRQFEDYGYDISEKAKTVTYGNMTAGQHDDAVSASYFAVADVTIDTVEEASNFYDSNNMFFIKNKSILNREIKGSFY